MPHGHVALLGAFGYIAIAFIYMTARANALAKNLEWDDRPSLWGFWLLTVGVVLYALPTRITSYNVCYTKLLRFPIDQGKTRKATEVSAWEQFAFLAMLQRERNNFV